MKSAQKSGRKSGRWRKSSETTSDLSAASAAAEKKRRGKPARAVTRLPDAKPLAVSPSSPVSHTPQTHAVYGLRSRNAAAGSVGKPARGRRKQARKSERTDRCPDPDTTQRHARVTPSPRRRSARTRGSKTAKGTHATLSPPRDTPLSSPKSEPGEETPRRRRGRPPKPHLSSTPQRRRTPPSLPQISPVTKTQSDKSVRSQNPEARKRSRSKKAEQEVRDTPPVKRQRKKRAAKAEPPQTQRIRTRFVLEDSELREPEESLSSSDLSIELSVQEEKLPLAHTLALEEDDEEEEEEELPSFLQQIRRKSSSIREGLCVWYKLRKFPFWPAVVKRVNRKTKKASIVFVDHSLFDKKTNSKGFLVSLRTLKPFDCEESHHFVDMAKKFKGGHIVLCLALISDYNIRIGCGSFVGSFLDYVADDISQPLRREILRADFLSPTHSVMEQQNGDSELQDLEEHPNLLQNLHVRQKVLPDRTLAARNRTNQQLVDFIIKKKGAQGRLLAVIRGNQESRWLRRLRSLRSCSRASVEQVYLEDEKQFYAVYHYLEELWHSAAKANRHLEKSDPIRYILDVLFPEALIFAISVVDSISLDKAEKKYRQGPQHSNRERQEFDLLIEQQMYLAATDPL